MKILIIDDHCLFREGLHYVLFNLDEEIQTLDAADHAQAVQQIGDNADIDLVLLGVNSPGKQHGFDVLEALAKRYPALPVVILSASNQHCDMQRALEAGAMGYIVKNTSSDVILGALKLVLAGGIYVSPDVACSAQQRQEISQSNSNLLGLTPRQLDVLRLLVQGYPNKEIAMKMAVAESTVKMHITSILKSLNVNSRTQAVIIIKKLGIFSSQYGYG